MRFLYLASVWLHILAAMTWVGGMVVFVLALMPFLRRQSGAVRAALLEDFGRRFRNVEWLCFVVLAATGTFNLWMRGVRLGDFARPEWRASAFGELVLLKVSLVFVAMVITWLHERAVSSRHARWLGRLTLVVALAIVAVAVGLVRT